MIREDIEREDLNDEDLLPRPEDFERNTRCTYWKEKLDDDLYTNTGITTESESYLMIERSEPSLVIYMEAILEIWNRQVLVKPHMRLGYIQYNTAF